MKIQYVYHWLDASRSSGDMARARVAYLLRAAKSRGQAIRKLDNGYRIDSLLLIQTVTSQLSQR